MSSFNAVDILIDYLCSCLSSICSAVGHIFKDCKLVILIPAVSKDTMKNLKYDIRLLFSQTQTTREQDKHTCFFASDILTLTR